MVKRVGIFLRVMSDGLRSYDIEFEVCMVWKFVCFSKLIRLRVFLRGCKILGVVIRKILFVVDDFFNI